MTAIPCPTDRARRKTRVESTSAITKISEGIEVPDDGSYETVGGSILAALGRIAVPGDTVDGPGYRIEVTAVDGLRIARVRIVTEPFPDAGQPGR